MPGLAYDDSGVLAAYFGITCLSFILLPATFFTLRKSLVGDEKSRAAKNECSCQECRAKVKNIKKAEAKSIFSKRYVSFTTVPRSQNAQTTSSIDISLCFSVGYSSLRFATTSLKLLLPVPQFTTPSRFSEFPPQATKPSSRNTLSESL